MIIKTPKHGTLVSFMKLLSHCLHWMFLIHCILSGEIEFFSFFFFFLFSYDRDSLLLRGQCKKKGAKALLGDLGSQPSPCGLQNKMFISVFSSVLHEEWIVSFLETPWALWLRFWGNLISTFYHNIKRWSPCEWETKWLYSQRRMVLFLLCLLAALIWTHHVLFKPLCWT